MNQILRLYGLLPRFGAWQWGLISLVLIHANSNTMRQWLWGDTIDCIGHFNPSDPACILYAFAAVSAVFLICVAIEMLRQRLIEATTLDPIHSRLKKILS